MLFKVKLRTWPLYVGQSSDAGQCHMICAAKSIHHPDQDWPRYIKVQLNYIQLYHYGICTSPSIQSLLNAEYIGVVPLEKGPLLDYCAPPQHTPRKHTWWHLYFQLYPIPFECKIYRSGPPGQGSFIGLLHPTPRHPRKTNMMTIVLSSIQSLLNPQYTGVVPLEKGPLLD